MKVKPKVLAVAITVALSTLALGVQAKEKSTAASQQAISGKLLAKKAEIQKVENKDRKPKRPKALRAKTAAVGAATAAAAGAAGNALASNDGPTTAGDAQQAAPAPSSLANAPGAEGATVTNAATAATASAPAVDPTGFGPDATKAGAPLYIMLVGLTVLGFGTLRFLNRREEKARAEKVDPVGGDLGSYRQCDTALTEPVFAESATNDGFPTWVKEFEGSALQRFTDIQAANSQADMVALSKNIGGQLLQSCLECIADYDGQPDNTKFLDVAAETAGMANTQDGKQIISMRYTGVQENPDGSREELNEVWHFVRTTSDKPWLLMEVEQPEKMAA